MKKEECHGIPLYIKYLKKNEAIGRFFHSIGISAVIALVVYAMYANTDKTLIHLGNHPLNFITNIVGLSLFFFALLVAILYLLLSSLSKPRNHEMLITVSDMEISKLGNSYYSGADRLFVPCPWAGYLPTKKSVRCKIGIWSSFSLIYNGMYLLEIEEEGFIMANHEGYGFFKYKDPMYLTVEFVFSLGALFFLYIFSGGFQRTDLGSGLYGIFAGIGLFTVFLVMIIIQFFRNLIIKGQIKRTVTGICQLGGDRIEL